MEQENNANSGQLLFNTIGANASTIKVNSVGTASFSQYGAPTLVSTTLFEDRVEKVFKALPNYQVTTLLNFNINTNPLPPKVWKEIWRPKIIYDEKEVAQKGFTEFKIKIVLSETIQGSYRPAHNVEEEYSFN